MATQTKPETTNGTVARRPDRTALAETGRKIDVIATTYVAACKESKNDYERACLLACSLIDLRVAVKEYLPVLRQLQGSRLGFKTDKDKEGGYADQILIDCAIEAVMRGVRWTGNEFNIIANNCYITKEGCIHLVNDLDGISDLILSPGVPALENGRTIVPYSATWKIHGKADALECKLPIRVNSGMGDDAVLGKAERKFLYRIYKRLTDFDLPGGEVDEETKPNQSTIADRSANYMATPPAAIESAEPEKTQPPSEKKKELDPENPFTNGEIPPENGGLYGAGGATQEQLDAMKG